MRRDIQAALLMLTRLPAGGLDRSGRPPELGRSVWAYPLVGLLVGGIGAAAYAALLRLGEPRLMAALLALAAMLLATGALHEDGLADTADGFGGGATPARRLEIMRDSRIGAYGALALIVAVGLRVSGLAILATPLAAARALLVAGCLGRAAIVLLLALLPAARTDGIAASLRTPAWATAVALAVAVLIPPLLLPLPEAASVLVGAVVATLALAALARRQIGGQTGDVLGCGSVLVECVVLSLLARSM